MPIFQISVVPIPGLNHTGIVVLNPGGPATTSEGGGSRCVVRNSPRGPPTQRAPRGQIPVGPRGSLSGQCMSLGPPGPRGPYPGSGSVPPPGLVSGPRFTVVGMPQLEAFAGHWQ